MVPLHSEWSRPREWSKTEDCFKKGPSTLTQSSCRTLSRLPIGPEDSMVSNRLKHYFFVDF